MCEHTHICTSAWTHIDLPLHTHAHLALWCFASTSPPPKKRETKIKEIKIKRSTHYTLKPWQKSTEDDENNTHIQAYSSSAYVRMCVCVCKLIVKVIDVNV